MQPLLPPTTTVSVWTPQRTWAHMRCVVPHMRPVQSAIVRLHLRPAGSTEHCVREGGLFRVMTQPLSAEARSYLIGEGENLYWNDLEWERITDEEPQVAAHRFLRLTVVPFPWTVYVAK